MAQQPPCFARSSNRVHINSLFFFSATMYFAFGHIKTQSIFNTFASPFYVPSSALWGLFIPLTMPRDMAFCAFVSLLAMWERDSTVRGPHLTVRLFCGQSSTKPCIHSCTSYVTAFVLSSWFYRPFDRYPVLDAVSILHLFDFVLDTQHYARISTSQLRTCPCRCTQV